MKGQGLYFWGQVNIGLKIRYGIMVAIQNRLTTSF